MPQRGWDQLVDWLIDAERELLARDHDYRPDGWRASEFGYCDRRMILKRAGLPETRKIDTKTRRTFRWGDMIEHFVVDVFEKTGLLRKNPAHPRGIWALSYGSLRGHLDALTAGPPVLDLKDWWSGEYKAFMQAVQDRILSEEWYEELAIPTALEIKSAHSHAMRIRRDKGAYNHHVGQVAAMALMQKHNPVLDPAPLQWKILYVGKDSVGTLTFDLPGGMIEQAERKLERLDAAWEQFRVAGELPACRCPQLEQSRFCAYAVKDGCCGMGEDDLLREALASSLAQITS